MNETPCFPVWRSRLAPLGSRSAQVLRDVRAHTLNQLETALGSWIPATLFPKAQAKENSRDRIYCRWRTFWCMVWQGLHPGAPGREVVAQLRALFCLEGGKAISEEDGAYCRAKARLPLGEFRKALSATALAADRLVPASTLLRGRPVKVVDGSTLTMSDTPNNKAAYPPLQCPKPNQPCFPILRLVVFFSLLSGAITALAEGSLAVSELGLFGSLLSQLATGDIVLGDRGFGCFPLIALLREVLQVDFIGRTTRRVDGRRRVKKLGRNDWLVHWTKSSCASPWLTAEQRASLPAQMTLRAVKGGCFQKGYRVRQVTVVTTLLDPELYPAQEILRAYCLRWRLEMCLDDLKTTLQMEMLRGKSPAMVRKEALVRLISHNLIRCTAAQSAREHGVALDRISFKGTLDSMRHFTEAMARTCSRKKKAKLWAELLQGMANDLVPKRPGRREPRAVKRKKNKYPTLNKPRHKFQDHPKRNQRRSNARLRKLGLM